MNFSEEWDKLQNLRVGDVITSVRWQDYPTDDGDYIPINLRGETIAYGKVVAVDLKRLCEIRESFAKFDTSETMTLADFFLLMKRFYSRKDNWKDWDSVVKIFFIKITSLA